MALSMKQGTYTGTGVERSITGLGFEPKVVFVRELVASVGDDGGSWRAAGMPANSANPIGQNGGFHTDGVRSLDSDGFTVGTSGRVNFLGAAYYYLALGGTDCATGSYSGNSTDDRNITGVGFDPIWVVIGHSHNTHFSYLTDQSTGGNSDYFTALAETTNNIQALITDGFQVGNGTTVNITGNTYYWFALKAGSQVKTGSYTGNAVDGRSITGVGFNPVAVIIKVTDSANPGVFRPASLAGDNCIKWSVAGGANLIQSLITDGFTVGTDVTVNDSGRPYHWIAFVDTAPAAGGVPNSLMMMGSGI